MARYGPSPSRTSARKKLSASSVRAGRLGGLGRVRHRRILRERHGQPSAMPHAERRDQRRRHRRRADLQEAPEADVLALAADRLQPQDRREAAGDRQVGAEVDADQQRVDDQPRRLRLRDRGARDQAGGQVVDQVGPERQHRARHRRRAAPDRPTRVRSQRGDPRRSRRCGSSASTSTNSPATSGSTLHDTSRAQRDRRRPRERAHQQRRDDAGDRGRQAELDVERRHRQQHERGGDDARPARPGRPVDSGARSTALTQLPASRSRSTQRSATKVTTIAASDGSANDANHCPSGGMLPAVEDEVGGVGDRQHEARRIGDQRAGEQQRQRIGLRLARRGVDRRGQHHRGGVVRQEGRGDDAGRDRPARTAAAVDPARVDRRGRRDPVEQSLDPRRPRSAASCRSGTGRRRAPCRPPRSPRPSGSSPSDSSAAAPAPPRSPRASGTGARSPRRSTPRRSPR